MQGTSGVTLVQKRERRDSTELAVTAQSAILVRVDLEDGEQLGQLQKIMHFFRQLQELHCSAAVLHSHVGADEFADARAIDVVDVGQIQQDERTLLVQSLADSLPQERTAFAQGNTTADVDDGDSGSITICGSQ